MQTAKAYLETLYQRRPELFPSGLNPSPLTEHDIQELENRVGYPFPRQYRSYLQAYQVPRISTSVRFCTSHVYMDVHRLQTCTLCSNYYADVRS